jgi:CHAT domain-containing protein/ribosomal protein S16
LHQAWYGRGFALNNLGRYDEAIASYDRAIEIQPDLHQAWYNRGFALNNLERDDEAIASYNRAIEIKPDKHEAWLNRGFALNNLGRYDEAIASYDRAIEIKPNYHKAWSNRGIAFGNWKGYESKIDAYHEAFQHIHSDTHPEGWGFLQHRIGRTHYQEGINQLLNYRNNPRIYYDQAITAYNKALQTLTRQQFPELRLETLIDLAQVQIAQYNNTDAAHESKKEALALTDEPLTAKHIAQLNLSSYNLVTLAACETAITGRTNINTEYVGLSSAFLQAGVANILSTLWEVDDTSTAWFTIYFHQQLLTGYSPAIALTRTQIWLKTVTWQHLVDWLLELQQLPHLNIGIVDKLQSHITNTLEDGGTIGLDRPSKYNHPYHWAAFTLTGRG